MTGAVSPHVSATYIFGIVFALLAVTVYFADASVVVEQYQWKWVALMSIASYAKNLFCSPRCEMLRARYSTAIRSSSIVFVTLIAWLFLNETLTWLKMAGAVLTTVGVALVAL